MTAIVAAVVFAVLAVAVERRWGPLVRLDQRVDDALNGHAAAHPTEVRFWRGLSAVLSPAVLRTALLLAAGWALYRRWIQPAVLCAGASLGSVAIVTAVKDGVGRVRPVVPVRIATAPGASFPSGHATTAMAAALTVIVLAWPRLAARGRWLVSIAAVVIALAVCFSRLVLGVHFLSDVVGGCLGATALVFGVVALVRVEWQERRRPVSRWRSASR